MAPRSPEGDAESPSEAEERPVDEREADSKPVPRVAKTVAGSDVATESTSDRAQPSPYRVKQRELRPAAKSIREWIDGAPLPREIALFFGLVAPSIVLLLNMWKVRSFTVDDAYISFRYARNFSRGLGLVYNPGERIEGYTNFLWTVMLGIGIKVGFDPDVLAKV